MVQKQHELFLRVWRFILQEKKLLIRNSDKITIEHIMPQTLNDSWLNEIGGSDEVHRKYRDTLGNLLLGINSELGNMIFSEKKKMYAESGVSMNRDLFKYERWSEQEILKRASILADYAVKIWPRYSS